MKEKTNKTNKTKQGFLSRLMEKLDKQLEAKSQAGSCCCKKNKQEGDSCCR
ncbi:MAG: hypothetical protein M0Q96_05230 [Candidatus Omnitrophica bacterium]|nr:hypothetical protein [Candidatus Omnitrophota bacterium]